MLPVVLGQARLRVQYGGHAAERPAGQDIIMQRRLDRAAVDAGGR